MSKKSKKTLPDEDEEEKCKKEDEAEAEDPKKVREAF